MFLKFFLLRCSYTFSPPGPWAPQCRFKQTHLFKKLCIYFWPCRVLVAASRISPASVRGRGKGAAATLCYGARVLTVVPSPLQSASSRHTASVVVVHGLSCPMACGILLAQGSNPGSLYWQADSYPLGDVSAKLSLICG